MVCRCPKGWCYQRADCRQKTPPPVAEDTAAAPPATAAAMLRLDWMRTRLGELYVEREAGLKVDSAIAVMIAAINRLTPP
jgi:hypothetical protein